MKYNKTSKTFLGESTDMTNHHFCAFKIDQEIHIVYNINTLEQHVSKEKIQIIQNNINNYLWTPYAQFI